MRIAGKGGLIMAWFKVDDGFYDHPKFIGLDMASIGLWACAGAYCSRHLTDGIINMAQIRTLRGTKHQAEKLVSVGLWLDLGGVGSSRTYAFNDWDTYQPTRAETLRKRETEAERLARHRRARAAQGSREACVDPAQASDSIDVDTTRASRDDLNEAVNPPDQQECENVRAYDSVTKKSRTHVPSRPVPSRPDPTPLLKEGSAEASPAPSNRGSRLSGSWSPDPSVWDDMLSQFPDVDLKLETEQFRDYWIAKSGKDATKLDWNRTWRNWIRKSQTFNNRNSRARSSNSTGKELLERRIIDRHVNQEVPQIETNK